MILFCAFSNVISWDHHTRKLWTVSFSETQKKLSSEEVHGITPHSWLPRGSVPIIISLTAWDTVGSNNYIFAAGIIGVVSGWDLRSRE